MLSTFHNVNISLRTLKTRLKEAGLNRRLNYSPLPEVRRAILIELEGPGQLFGYRTMWQVLQQKHRLRVKRDVVMRLLKQLNPRGTALRTRRRFTRRTYHSMGPNYIWHVDGYDKLKPFGLGLSGCIDGFSRKIMWLVCGPTNNNPSVIAHNYINCAKSVGVVPMRLRTDLGTENGTMAAIQCTLRHVHTDYYAGASSHSYGSSTGNQRIEAWWSFFRRGRLVHLCLMDEKYCVIVIFISIPPGACALIRYNIIINNIIIVSVCALPRQRLRNKIRVHGESCFRALRLEDVVTGRDRPEVNRSEV